MTSAPLLRLRGITRTFSVPGAPPLRILTGVDLDVHPGEHVAVVGRSGTGKSTLLNILGLIDVPTSGGYQLNGVDVAGLGESRRAHLRGQTFGFGRLRHLGQARPLQRARLAACDLLGVTKVWTVNGTQAVTQMI